MSKKHKRKSRSPGKPLWYQIDPSDPMQLILRNGTRIRKGELDVEVYLTTHMGVYAMSRNKLIPRRIDNCKKRNYCKRILTGRGHHQGQRYPRVTWHGHKYHLHTLMAKAWKGGLPLGMVADHIDGNIDDFSFDNIRVIDIPENNRCGGILKRLRNAARKHNLPLMDPSKRTPEDMLALYDRFEGRNLDEAMSEEIERQKVMQKLRESAIALRDPSLDPKNIEPERLEKILSTLRVEDPKDIMDDDFKHHREF